jgi:hypothetical protein
VRGESQIGSGDAETGLTSVDFSLGKELECTGRYEICRDMFHFKLFEQMKQFEAGNLIRLHLYRKSTQSLHSW